MWNICKFLNDCDAVAFTYSVHAVLQWDKGALAWLYFMFCFVSWLDTGFPYLSDAVPVHTTYTTHLTAYSILFCSTSFSNRSVLHTLISPHLNMLPSPQLLIPSYWCFLLPPPPHPPVWYPWWNRTYSATLTIRTSYPWSLSSAAYPADTSATHLLPKLKTLGTIWG